MFVIAVWETKPSNEGTVVRWIGARCRYWAGELPACGSVRIVVCGSARIGGSLTHPCSTCSALANAAVVLERTGRDR